MIMDGSGEGIMVEAWKGLCSTFVSCVVLCFCKFQKELSFGHESTWEVFPSLCGVLVVIICKHVVWSTRACEYKVGVDALEAPLDSRSILCFCWIFQCDFVLIQ